MSEQPEALRLASLLENKLGGTADDDIEQAAAELRRLHAENEALKSVMVAAAEEISSHWDAHCDSEGYGPVNLMRRLEQGIPSQYGYTAGEFERLRALNAAYAAGIAAEREACARVCEGQGVGRRALEHYAALTYSGAAHDCAASIRARGEG